MTNYKKPEPQALGDQVDVALGTHESPHKLHNNHKRNPERYDTKEAHHVAEKARHEAINEASMSKEQGQERRSPQANRHNKTLRHNSAVSDREIGFEQTMQDVRKELPRSNRWFSDLIHQARIERLSDTIGNTVARPSAILAGSLTAFLVVTSLYSYAKFAGFTLQGSETIVAFIGGWAFGLLIDILKNLFTKNR